MIDKEDILHRFAYRHMPTRVADVAAHFCDLAELLLEILPDGDEKTKSITRLFDARNAAINSVFPSSPKKVNTDVFAMEDVIAMLTKERDGASEEARQIIDALVTRAKAGLLGSNKKTDGRVAVYVEQEK